MTNNEILITLGVIISIFPILTNIFKWWYTHPKIKHVRFQGIMYQDEKGEKDKRIYVNRAMKTYQQYSYLNKKEDKDWIEEAKKMLKKRNSILKEKNITKLEKKQLKLNIKLLKKGLKDKEKHEINIKCKIEDIEILLTTANNGCWFAIKHNMAYHIYFIENASYIPMRVHKESITIDKFFTNFLYKRWYKLMKKGVKNERTIKQNKN